MKAGIYVHIPFCRKACHYCDFHFSTQLKYKSEMVASIIRELEQRASSYQQYQIESIYLGGGTPSVLEDSELDQIMEVIYKRLDIDEHAEVTLEANPDDLDGQKLIAFRKMGINRLSLGIQSFFDAHLKWMNRSHSANQAIECIHLAKEEGFQSINADLIFAIPGMTMQQWISNIERFISFDIQHWSCYNLTVEPKTAFYHQVKKGLVQPIKDEMAALQYQTLISYAQEAGMEHYEISNFCKPGKYSVHNSNYWRGISYLGIGPSAHSYNGKKRSWNKANNALYMKAISAGEPFSKEEKLTISDKYNEYVLTGLRTRWGCDLENLHLFGKQYAIHFSSGVERFLMKGWVKNSGTLYQLTNQGKLFADQIASELFWVEDED